MSNFQDHDHDDIEITGYLEKPGRLSRERRDARQRRHRWEGKQARKRQPGNGRRAQQTVRRLIAEADSL